MKHFFRTRIGKDIICEFIPGRKDSRRVAVICRGMPTLPAGRSLAEFWARKGYWVFNLRYRGSWESGGRFLRYSPEKDVLDVLKALPKGFTDLKSGKRYRVNPRFTLLVGGSFGGPAVLLASRDRRVDKVICVSPVVDWREPSRDEPLDRFYGYVKDAFGEAYRMSKKDWNKLKTGKFYNPAAHAGEIDGSKVFMVHAKDDRTVSYRSVKKFTDVTGSSLYTLPRGGHLPSAVLSRRYLYRRIKKFLNS